MSLARYLGKQTRHVKIYSSWLHVVGKTGVDSQKRCASVLLLPYLIMFRPFFQ